MTHVFPFYGTVSQYWDVFYSECRRLAEVLGRRPFEFETPKHSIINEYVPKDGDEIIVNFWDSDRKRILLVVEAEIVADENRQYNISVHPQGNSFEEPFKSAISIWKEIKTALQRTGSRSAPLKRPQRKKKRGPHASTLIAIKYLREIHAKASISKDTIITRETAANRVGIAINTWRKYDLQLWDHWENKSYWNQNMQ